MNDDHAKVVAAFKAVLREAIHIAWRRGRGEFPPEDSDRLAELEKLTK